MPMITINCRKIKDWASFHTVFATTLGFPGYYGHNMDAWIDCMTCLDDPEAGMTNVHVTPPDVLVLHLKNISAMKKRCPEVFSALVECAGFVNWRRIETGDPSVLALSFNA